MRISDWSSDVCSSDLDAKSQVTLLYKNGKPTGATAIVVSTQHALKDKKGRLLESGDIKRLVRPYVLKALPKGWMCDDEHFYVTPTGRFVIGGPDGDAGLTGRKIIVDTYGGAAPHGGGAFSGKDPTKEVGRAHVRTPVTNA